MNELVVIVVGTGCAGISTAKPVELDWNATYGGDVAPKTADGAPEIQMTAISVRTRTNDQRTTKFKAISSRMTRRRDPAAAYATATGVKTSPDAILAAAYVCFARYGFKRVALEQIAQEAGISRAALYLHFRNKGAILRALSHQHHEQMQSEAARAARLPGSLDKRLEAILCAKLGQLVDRIYASSHAAEILDENSRLCGDDSGVYHKKFPRVLRVPPAEAAELLLDSAKGLDRSGLAGNPARHRLRSSN